MKRINLLPKSIYNRIAAGEVVDRPYSVVKELVENSIDAGATDIEIYIETGGKQLIKVVDNGTGIYKDDLPSAFLPHATSKILEVDDLDDISTLGFRGEALASISAVSKAEIISVTSGNPAYRITCEGGVMGEVEPAAIDNGTVITIRDLFYNTPVRAKFLKTDKKEETDITTLVSRYILGNSAISFRYFVDGKLTLQSFGGGLEEAVAQVYGAKVISQCFKIDAVKDNIHLCGYIGNQNFFKPNKSYQTTFVNGRYIVNGTINTAISNAYSSYAMRRQFPFYVLNIEVPSDFIDVNVHPNKADVRFADTNKLFGVVYKIISSVLDGTASAAEFVVTRTPEIKSTAPVQEEIDVSQELIDKYKPEKYVDFPEDILKPQEPLKDTSISKRPDDIKGFNPEYDMPLYQFFGAEESLRMSGGTRFQLDDTPARLSDPSITPSNPFLAKAAEIEREYLQSRQERIDYETFKYRCSIFNTYLVYECRDIVYLIDQHAAHERLLYDKLIAKVRERKVVRQPMLDPYIITANTEEREFIKNNLQFLNDIGFSVAPFGRDMFRVDEVPADLPELNIKEFFNEFLSELNSFKDIKLEELFKDKLAQTACKHAVKGGMKLSDAEAETLFKMMEGNTGLKCPHGRPVCVQLTKRQIEKMFKRIV